MSLLKTVSPTVFGGRFDLSAVSYIYDFSAPLILNVFFKPGKKTLNDICMSN